MKISLSFFVYWSHKETEFRAGPNLAGRRLVERKTGPVRKVRVVWRGREPDKVPSPSKKKVWRVLTDPFFLCLPDRERSKESAPRANANRPHIPFLSVEVTTAV